VLDVASTAADAAKLSGRGNATKSTHDPQNEAMQENHKGMTCHVRQLAVTHALKHVKRHGRSNPRIACNKQFTRELRFTVRNLAGDSHLNPSASRTGSVGAPAQRRSPTRRTLRIETDMVSAQRPEKQRTDESHLSSCGIQNRGSAGTTVNTRESSLAYELRLNVNEALRGLLSKMGLNPAVRVKRRR
jgi:hypothetical protein